MTRIPALQEIDKYYMSTPMPKPTNLDPLYPEPPSFDMLEQEIRAEEATCKVAAITAAVFGIGMTVAAVWIWVLLVGRLLK